MTQVHHTKFSPLGDEGELYPHISTGALCRSRFGGNGISADIRLWDRQTLDFNEKYVWLERDELVVVVCRIRDVIERQEDLSGTGLILDDLLCLTKKGFVWIESYSLEEVA